MGWRKGRLKGMRCPKCGGVLYGIYVHSYGEGYRPTLRYCRNCDKVYRVKVVEEQVDIITVSSRARETKKTRK